MNTSPLGRLPLDRLLKANEVCNRFESALEAGVPVRVEDFLTEVSDEDRPLVRTELNAILNERGEDKGPPREVGAYVVEEELGRGGMGQVWRGLHRTMKRRVALKFLHVPESAQEAAADQRFQREVEILARLQHPNLVAAFDAGRQGPWRYLVTELIDGIDLARWVKAHGPMDAERVLDVALQTCAGLDYLHAQGVIHRDLKPANLMIDAAGRVRILDVGLARALGDGPSTLSHPGLILGTVDFMAPEQAGGPRDVDARSDLYSLGASLFFLLEGKLPFSGRGAFEIIAAKRAAQAPEVAATIPSGLRELLRELLARNPSERPASARLVIERVKAMRQNDGRTGPIPLAATEKQNPLAPAPLPRSGAEVSGRRRSAIILAAAGVTVLAAVVAFILLRDPTEPTAPPAPPTPTLADYPLADPAAYQEHWAKHLTLPVKMTDETGLEFVFIPPGRFQMGTPDEDLEALLAREPDGDIRGKKLAEKARPLTLDKPFYLSAKEVTIGQFRRYIEATGDSTNAEKFGNGWGVIEGKWEQRPGFSWHNFGEQSAADDIPVGNLTWDEADRYCRWLTSVSKSRARYRLPLEAEWEYACRGGSVGPYCCGDLPLKDFAVFAANSENRLLPVGSRKPNAFGLFDMHGNHAEWCGVAEPGSPLFTPIPDTDPNNRPSRGGNFFDTAERIRSAARNWGHGASMGKGGLRVVKEIGP